MVDQQLRVAVAERASYRCEYCRMHEDDDVFTFHVEHIIARKHDGETSLANLAYACQQCNLHKGPNLSGIDPDSQEIVELFHPRNHEWDDHLQFDGPRVIGLTPTGRATVRVLNMNDGDRIAFRMEDDEG